MYKSLLPLLSFSMVNITQRIQRGKQQFYANQNYIETRTKVFHKNVSQG